MTSSAPTSPRAWGSKEDRDTNILRIGWWPNDVPRRRRGGLAPYREARDRVRATIPAFVEVYVQCSVEERPPDRKGLYEKAFRGEITGFTGVDDPYEPPENPEVVVDTERRSPEECLDILVRRLEELGYLRPAA